MASRGVLVALVLCVYVSGSHAQSMADRYPFCADAIRAFEAHRDARKDNRNRDPESRRVWNERLQQLQQAYQRCVSGVAQTRRGHRFDTEPVRFVRADDRHIVTLSDGGQLVVWNRATGRARSLHVDDGHWLSIDGVGHVVVGGRRGSLVVDAATLERRERLPQPQVLAAGSVRVAVGLDGKSLHVLPSGDERQAKATAMQRTLAPLALHADGEIAWNGQQLIRLADAATATPLASRPLPAGFAASALLVADRGGALMLYDLEGALQHTYRLPPWQGIPVAVAARPDARVVAVAERSGRVLVFDLRTEEVLQTYTHAGEVTDLQFTDAHLLSSSADGSVRLSRGDTVLGELVSFASGGWAVLTESGMYDAPQGGSGLPLRWYAHQRELALEQLAAGFWSPGLLGGLLASGATTPRAPAVEPPPDIHAALGEGDRAHLRLEGDAASAGRIQVLLNGKEIALEQAAIAGANQPIELPASGILRGRENVLEARVWNRAETIASRGSRVVWTDQQPRSPEVPALHVLAVGVSDYAGDTLDLQFAAQDAQRFAQALAAAGGALFGPSRVHVHTLVDDRTSPSALRSAFTQLAQARAEDVLVIYLAGHGISTGDEYYYLTAAAQHLEAAPGTAVSSDELVRLIRAIPARKQVMVLDTCAAGALRSRLASPPGVPAAQARALARLHQRTGFHVLMGSAADRFSFEASRYGQGLLTYALLEGMHDAALGEDGMLDVSGLFQYAVDRVPVLARGLGGVQQPLVSAPDAASFDIGRVTADVRRAIPLAQPRPLLAVPAFVSVEQGYDAQAVGERFRELLAVRSRGGEALPVLLHDDSLPGVLRLTGTYEDRSEGLSVRAALRDGDKVLVRMQFDSANASAAARDLLDRLLAALPAGSAPDHAG